MLLFPPSPAARYLQLLPHIARMAILTPLAAYYIAFGPHGPRAEAPPGEGMKIFQYTMYGVLISIGLFYLTRVFARGPPKTMSAEWQEASNAYMKVRFHSIFHASGVIPVTSE
jgi:hypothetical protein